MDRSFGKITNSRIPQPLTSTTPNKENLSIETLEHSSSEISHLLKQKKQAELKYDALESTFQSLKKRLELVESSSRDLSKKLITESDRNRQLESLVEKKNDELRQKDFRVSNLQIQVNNLTNQSKNSNLDNEHQLQVVTRANENSQATIEQLRLTEKSAACELGDLSSHSQNAQNENLQEISCLKVEIQALREENQQLKSTDAPQIPSKRKHSATGIIHTNDSSSDASDEELKKTVEHYETLLLKMENEKVSMQKSFEKKSLELESLEQQSQETKGEQVARQALQEAKYQLERLETQKNSEIEALNLQLTNLSSIKVNNGLMRELQIQLLAVEEAARLKDGLVLDLECSKMELNGRIEDLIAQLQSTQDEYETKTKIQNEEIQSLQQELVVCSTAKDINQKQLDSLGNTLQELNAQLEAKQTQLADSQVEIQGLERKLVAYQMKMQTYHSQSELDKDTLDEMVDDLQSKTESVTSLKKELAGVQEQLLASNKDLQTKTRALAQASTEFSGFKDLLDQVKETEAQLNARILELEAQVSADCAGASDAPICSKDDAKVRLVVKASQKLSASVRDYQSFVHKSAMMIGTGHELDSLRQLFAQFKGTLSASSQENQELRDKIESQKDEISSQLLTIQQLDNLLAQTREKCEQLAHSRDQLALSNDSKVKSMQIIQDSALEQVEALTSRLNAVEDEKETMIRMVRDEMEASISLAQHEQQQLEREKQSWEHVLSEKERILKNLIQSKEELTGLTEEKLQKSQELLRESQGKLQKSQEELRESEEKLESLQSLHLNEMNQIQVELEHRTNEISVLKCNLTAINDENQCISSEFNDFKVKTAQEIQILTAETDKLKTRALSALDEFQLGQKTLEATLAEKSALLQTLQSEYDSLLEEKNAASAALEQQLLHIEQLLQEKSQASTALQEAVSVQDALNSRMMSLEQDLTVKNSEICDQSSEITALTSKVDTLQNQVLNAQQSLAESQEQIASLTSATTTHQYLKSQLDQLEADLRLKQEEIKQFEQAIVIAQQVIQNKDELLDSLQRNAAAFEVERAESQQAFDKLTSKITLLHSQLNEEQEQVQLVREQMQQGKKLLEQDMEQLKLTQEQLAQEQAEKSGLQQRLTNANDEKSELANQVQTLADELSQANDQHALLQEQITQIKNENDLLVTQISETQGLKGKIDVLMQEKVFPCFAVDYQAVAVAAHTELQSQVEVQLEAQVKQQVLAVETKLQQEFSLESQKFTALNESLIKEHQVIQAEFEALKSSAQAQLSATQRELDDASDLLKAQLDELQRTLHEKISRITSLEQQLNDQTASSDRLSSEIAALKLKLNSDNDEAQLSISALKCELSTAEEKVGALEAQLLVLKTELLTQTSSTDLLVHSLREQLVKEQEKYNVLTNQITSIDKSSMSSEEVRQLELAAQQNLEQNEIIQEKYLNLLKQNKSLQARIEQLQTVTASSESFKDKVEPVSGNFNKDRKPKNSKDECKQQ